MRSSMLVPTFVMLGSCASLPDSPRSCVRGLDLPTVARDHEAAWSAAFDGRPLTDRELLALADGQAVLDCLADDPTPGRHVRLALGDAAGQRVEVYASPSLSLHDLAMQVEAQTTGLNAYVDTSRQCVEVTERVDEQVGEYGISIDGQMATFSGVDLTPAEVVAQINRQLDNVVASVDERGSIMIDVSAYRSTISSDASIDVTAWTHDADDPIADETTLPALRNPDRLRPSERQRRRQQQTRDVTALRERRRGYARSSWSRP